MRVYVFPIYAFDPSKTRQDNAQCAAPQEVYSRGSLGFAEPQVSRSGEKTEALGGSMLSSFRCRFSSSTMISVNWSNPFLCSEVILESLLDGFHELAGCNPGFTFLLATCERKVFSHDAVFIDGVDDSFLESLGPGDEFGSFIE